MGNKKIITATCAALLAAALTAGGVTAYFTDGDSAANTFVLGRVELDLGESSYDPGKDNEGENDGPLTLVPLDEVAKNPTVSNTGINDEYIFMKVEVPTFTGKTIVSEDGTRHPNMSGEIFDYLVDDEYYGTFEAAVAAQDNFTVLESANGKAADENGFGSKIYTVAYGSGTDKASLAALSANETTPELFSKVRFKNFREDEKFEDYKTTDKGFDIDLKAYGIQSGSLTESAVTAKDVYDIIGRRSPTTNKLREDAATDTVAEP